MDLVAGTVPAFGNVFVVIPDGDVTLPNYSIIQEVFNINTVNEVRVFSTIEEVYPFLTSNNNDVVVLTGNSTHTLSTGLTVAKNRVNFIGFDGGPQRLQQQGAKVSVSGNVDTAFVLKNTGTRNSFHNIKFIQSSTHANALTCVQDGGEGTVWDHCSFTFGVADNLDQTTAHEFVGGSDSATYDSCVFGSDTLLTTAARSVFHIDQVNGFEFKSNIAKDCVFLISSSSSTATFVRLDAVGDILFTNSFIDCTFIASVDSAGGAAIANASQTGTGTVKGGLYYVRPAVFNVTDFSVATNGWNANTQVVAAISSANATEGIKPTA